MSSCCGGNCGCGSNCTCGNGCGGCKMYPDLSYSEVAATTVATVLGVARPVIYAEGAATAECGAAKCTANCTCNSCNCS